jgi:hypothetical protein
MEISSIADRMTKSNKWLGQLSPFHLPLRKGKTWVKEIKSDIYHHS